MLKKNKYSLPKVPVKQRTLEICLNAVKKDGRELKYVPKKLMTEELCLAAVHTDSSAFQYVPGHLRSAKLLSTAMQVKIYFNDKTPNNLKRKVEELFIYSSDAGV